MSCERPGQDGRAEEGPGRLVVATYNVRRCVGLDGRRSVTRTARVIRSLGADVVGLQEIDSEPSGEGIADQLLQLAEETGFTAVAAPTHTRTYGGYGNGLLTRLPVTRALRHDLSFAKKEPRGALEVDLAAPGCTIKVLTTHCGLRAGERRWQDERLRELVSTLDAPIVVVMGDFNEWHPFGVLWRSFDRMLGPSRLRRSFPAPCPILPLDRIWVRPRAAIEDLRVVRTSPARHASDHLPLRAVILCPPPPPV